ncbi:V-type ATP synthase subunit D [Ructibacterium gallinarum]|uniref:V-type ATP synthase subunit D n=1 Tax=Ructibacterium gallinarum TaxID=2779355 RepID=A0A9D5M4K6_9FIRM|nr:V-type ATP synthase subunit D [Ructibacterium gallinarum]MBE5039439.1 V-type ATP synthase subunit D [Ructibacterium gallinarum]
MAMVPTKGNLIIAKNTLALCRTGYDLLDKKRNILIREMMNLIDEAKKIQSTIETTFSEAYSALQQANIDIGIDTVEKLGYAIDVEDSVSIKFRSVMGVEIPIVIMDEKVEKPSYGMQNTTSSLDEAVVKFGNVKRLTRQLAQIEISVYRIADSVKKTQKRANALKNIMIPRYEAETRNIQNALEEKDREEFSRLKVIKAQKQKHNR